MTYARSEQPADANIEPALKTDAATPASWLGRHRGDLIAVLLVFIAYTATIWVAFNSTWIFAALTGAANTVPVIVFGAIVRRIIIKHLIGRNLLVQAAWHAGLCVGFSVAAYWLLLVMLAVANSPSPWNFTVEPFITRGTAWQLLENVTTYALVAALSYLQAARATPPPIPVPPPAQQAVKEPPRLLVRVGDELRPIDLDEIVTIAGADDYAEITTLTGKRLVAMTLAEFEQTLDPARFVRVHRSHIVNLDFVDHAEPAGAGRLLLHMKTGATVATSRAGARLLKSRVI
jgi:two-component system, LytTR family, response regulator